MSEDTRIIILYFIFIMLLSALLRTGDMLFCILAEIVLCVAMFAIVVNQYRDGDDLIFLGSILEELFTYLIYGFMHYIKQHTVHFGDFTVILVPRLLITIFALIVIASYLYAILIILLCILRSATHNEKEANR